MSTPKEMPKAYEPSAVENKWYPVWEERGYFHGTPDTEKKPYSIVIPPPNVTGILHLGHVLNNTLQDILIRWRKMQGYEVSWFPGTDHAGIATESKVEKTLRESGEPGRDDLGREKFIEKVWDWRKQYGGTIIKQLRKLGTSCDWERERFTMDEGLSFAVKKVFVELYNKGYIYRGQRMINWCPVAKTALSDEEVIYKDVAGKFYHYKYPLSDGSGFLEIATTRPETMLGDTAVAVHPEDERYKHLIGKTVDLPLTDRKIKIIADEHADPEKGTGCVKITPAHDPNDFEVGQRHNLEVLSIMNNDATLNAKCGPEFDGLDRFDARKKCVKMLEEQGLMIKIEDIQHAVGYSERGDVPIETMVSAQWFCNMKELAKPALEAVKNGEIKFHPERWSKTYFHWMENIQDWCISRQIWWGHRIPAWYNDATGEIFVGTEEPEEGGPWRQEEDVLDTWFSSWLWPFSVMGWPEKTEELEYFYPTGDLVTGPDIIFFWVARMIMAGCEFMDKIPFKNVYFTSIIRDDIGRKLSKSLGNSPDPLDVIDTYGADALRFSIIYIAPVGMDIRYSNEKCELGRNFANKLWNACRFRQMQGPVTEDFRDLSGVDHNKLTSDEKWIISWINEAIAMTNKSLEEFRFHFAAHEIYELVWNNFCDWFIETSKVRLWAGGEEKQQALQVLDFVLFKILRLLHPFMPFITEELAHQMGFLGEEQTIMHEHYPRPLEDLKIPSIMDKDPDLLDMVEAKFQIVRAGRSLKANYGIADGKKVNYFIKAINQANADFLKSEIASLKTLLNADEVEISLDDFDVDANGAAPSQLANSGTIYLPLKGLIDLDDEMKKLGKQKKQIIGWIKGSEAKLSNERFLSKAPEKVVTEAKEHLEGLKHKLQRVGELIAALQ
ncbi:MAG: valine--tRNA ligase [Lentisphaerae bacterium]|nr:valine--tRNA ligase [Lentisphaerota bacterium]MCP4102586.1 valine--tRNA ligase [Lentisphaerota bacterium]